MPKIKTRIDPMAWYGKAGFGLFIHWGTYSILGRGEQVLFRERLDAKAYRQLADRFKPERFDADEWAQLAKAGGVRYAVLTTKHHDGFCLFDSALTDYTSSCTGAGRDFVAEYVRALRRCGIGVGLYYSLADWSWPAYFRGPTRASQEFDRFISFVHGQVKELCSNYGQIDVLWFDGGWPYSAAEWHSDKLDRMIRRLQPNVMINDRLHGGGDGNVTPVGKASRRRRGYFNTFEQRAVVGGVKRPNEMCRTTQHAWWGDHRGDRLWKSPREVVNLLSTAASSGANLLLNVGPKSNGSLPAGFKRILGETGRWLGINGEAIYGAEPGILDVSTVGRTTVKGDRLFVHAVHWPGREFHVYGLANKVVSVRILGCSHRIDFSQSGLNLRLCKLPRHSPDASCAVIELRTDGRPKQHRSVIGLWEQGRDVSVLGDWVDGKTRQNRLGQYMMEIEREESANWFYRSWRFHQRQPSLDRS